MLPLNQSDTRGTRLVFEIDALLKITEVDQVAESNPRLELRPRIKHCKVENIAEVKIEFERFFPLLHSSAHESRFDNDSLKYFNCASHFTSSNLPELLSLWHTMKLATRTARRFKKFLIVRRAYAKD